MADYIGGIRQIGPTYPVKPVKPSGKDRKPGEQAPRQPEPQPESNDEDDGHSIDEHV